MGSYSDVDFTKYDEAEKTRRGAALKAAQAANELK